MRAVLALILSPLLLVMLATFAPPRLHAPRAIPETLQILFSPVALDMAEGALDYLEGWALTSDDPRFGGISAIHVDGGRVLAVSDAGALFRFSPPPAPSDPLVRSLDGPGARANKNDRDIEALAVASGRLWLAYEVHDMIWRYDADTLAAEAWAPPAAMRDWRPTRGAEAMVRLSDGRFLVFAEGDAREGGVSDVLLFDGDPALAATRSIALGYRAPAGYRITDAVLLPGRRLLFLNRRIGLAGFTAKLTLAALPPLAPGTILEGIEIADFSTGIAAENLEALGVTRENGRDLVWIASDDNFSPLQRTLLLKFSLKP